MSVVTPSVITLSYTHSHRCALCTEPIDTSLESGIGCCDGGSDVTVV